MCVSWASGFCVRSRGKGGGQFPDTWVVCVSVRHLGCVEEGGCGVGIELDAWVLDV